jgi:signal peptidase
MRPRTIALIALVALAAVLLVPRLLGVERYAITGGSMGKAIPAGSLVLAEPIDAGELRPGDVATFVPAGHGERVTHRVVATDGGIVTRGDANTARDPWRIAPGTPVHRVVADVPYAGRAVIALNEHAVLLLAFGILATLLAMAPPPSGLRRPGTTVRAGVTS